MTAVEATRPAAALAAEVARLRAENAALLAQMQHRDDELEVATRMLQARAQTMTSVIDAVTEQSIIGTDMTEARATERMKDQFVSLISHELRTPLTSILGYLELVLDDPGLGEEPRQHLATVERNAQRLLRLVGDLLFTAQVDAGRFTLQPEDVDLTGVVRAAEETARVSAGAAGVDVVVDLPDEGLVVHGDAVRLGQACDNLVSNAVKFTPAGGRVTLTLRAAWRTPDGAVAARPRDGAVPVARLAVSDTGIGIPAGEQAQLFARFFRASTARRQAVPGVGLGLAITRAIATAHDGTLEVTSVEGRGTTVTLTLPR